MTSAASAANDTSVAAYEELRRRIVAGSSCGSDFDVLVLIREGIAPWMTRDSNRAVPPPADLRQRVAATHALLANEIQADLVRGLASMALASRWERNL